MARWIIANLMVQSLARSVPSAGAVANFFEVQVLPEKFWPKKSCAKPKQLAIVPVNCIIDTFFVFLSVWSCLMRNEKKFFDGNLCCNRRAIALPYQPFGGILRVNGLFSGKHVEQFSRLAKHQKSLLAGLLIDGI